MRVVIRTTGRHHHGESIDRAERRKDQHQLGRDQCNIVQLLESDQFADRLCLY